MSDDEEFLLQQYKEVRNYGEGELRITVLPRGGRISVRIVGGKAKDFLVDKIEGGR